MRLIRILAVLLLFAVLAAAALQYFLNRPFARFQREAFVEIPKGASTREIAAMLAEASSQMTLPFQNSLGSSGLPHQLVSAASSHS